MPSISNDLNNRLQRVLLDCGPFTSNRSLSAVFIDARISFWRNRIPEADNPVDRIQAIVGTLYNQYTNAGKNGLVLFLHVLVDRTDQGDACNNRLAKLAEELERELENSDDTEVTSMPEVQKSKNNDEYGPPESPYGTMPPESKLYIERQADRNCWQYLNQGEAATIFVQAPRQMGKSSLIRRMMYRIQQTRDVEVIYIDFEKFTEDQFENEEEFLIEFCSMIGDALHLPDKIEQYWASRRRSNIVKCSNYMSQHLIATYNKPIILAMDETERLLTKPLCNDFFGMLRTWHNDRSWDTNFAKMTILISSSTEPYLFIDNPNQSPFNVASPILLHDFTQAEVEELNQRHRSPLSQPQLIKLVDLLEGHPFLTRLALYQLNTREIDFNSMLATASSDTGPFGDYLRRYWQNILDMPELKVALSRICHHKTYPEDKLFYRLKGAGLVKKVGSQVIMRNKLFERYFMERL